MALWPNNFFDIRGRFPCRLQGSPIFDMDQQRTNRNLAFFGNENIVSYTSIPEGMISSGVTILQPLDGGGMSLDSVSSGGLSGDLYASRSMSIDFTGQGDMTSSAGLVISMLTAMVGSGSMTATITGQLDASVDFTGSSSFSAALSAIASMAVDLTGVGDLDALVAAYGDMSIDIVVTGTGLTTANVGQAVWASIAAANDDPGTMGEKLNAAGSTGDPWTTALPGAYAAGTAGDIIGNIATKILQSTDGVETSIDLQQAMRAILAALTGKATGGDTTQITFRDPADTTDRVVMTVDEDGNRSNVTLNL